MEGIGWDSNSNRKNCDIITKLKTVGERDLFFPQAILENFITCDIVDRCKFVLP
jgi:hypothetical protein